MKKGIILLTALVVSAMPALANEYSILPVVGSEKVSNDGRWWMIDVMDVNYQNGTFVIDLHNNTFESTVGDRVDSGTVSGDSSTTDVASVYSEHDITAWNNQVASGQDPQPAAIRKVIVKYCQAANRQATLALLAAQAACSRAGGTHSGGSIGVCGIGADTGHCTVRHYQIEP